MKVHNEDYRTIWVKDDDNGNKIIQVIDQRWLPHEFVIEDLNTVEEFAVAIRDMHVRGAGLIGATASYGMYVGSLEAREKTNNSEEFDRLMEVIGDRLKATRPTAVNLEWAVNRELKKIKQSDFDNKVDSALYTAREIANEDAQHCKVIGMKGVQIIEDIYRKNKDVVNILTHCNAGWLAFVDWGSATSPIYHAQDRNIPVHVYVDETRPRNQGARLTAWELGQQGIPHRVIADNVGGHLMQQGFVDMVIVGADRVSYGGDVINKIGTYEKALVAKDNNVPFYVALPSSTFDWNMENGFDTPIEERSEEEVRYIQGLHEGEVKKVLLTPRNSKAINYAFDVTPRHLVSGLITERGICKANSKDIYRLFPEMRK